MSSNADTEISYHERVVIAMRIRRRISAYHRYCRSYVAPCSWIVGKIRSDLEKLGIPAHNHLIFVMNRYHPHL